MKYLVLILLFLYFKVEAHTICEKDLSNDYSFSYKIDNKDLTYKITKKNKEEINFFHINKYNYSNNLGFKLTEHQDINFIKTTLSVFLKENDQFYSINLIRGIIPYSFENISISMFFKKEKEINEQINLSKFINLFQVHINDVNRYGNQKIKFKVKLILDEKFNTCAEFSTEPFYYNMGSKFIFEFREKFNQFFYLWRN